MLPTTPTTAPPAAPLGRRPLRSSIQGWAARLGAAMARLGVHPDHVSAAKVLVVFAIGGCLALASGIGGTLMSVWLLAVALSFQLPEFAILLLMRFFLE